MSRKQSKLEKAIRAARKRLDAGNYIEAVKEIRQRYAEKGLKAAKDFTDWVRSRDDEHPADLAESWCEECWDIFPCKHSGHPGAMTAGAVATNRNEGTPRAAAGMREALASIGELGGDAAATANPKPECKCGDSACTDPWHYAARWVGQPGNYAKLCAWLRGEQVEGVPFEWKKT
jgi:hypothetical protein